MALNDATTTGGLSPALEPPLRRTAFTLAADEVSVSQARHRLLKHLRTWGIDQDSCDTAVLVVSELFTNAVVHTDTDTIECTVEATPDQLQIQVADRGTGHSIPSPQHTGSQDEGGRGLTLVEAVSQGWGVRPAGDGDSQVVWATLRVAQDRHEKRRRTSDRNTTTPPTETWEAGRLL